MAKICNNKKYRTRSGCRVIINRKRSSDEMYPVTGKMPLMNGGTLDLVWTEDGYFLYNRVRHRLDLVEV